MVSFIVHDWISIDSFTCYDNQMTAYNICQDWHKETGGTKIRAADYACFSSRTCKQRDFPRFSRPVPAMRPEYDVVVIGSGYGAGVAASRAARAGKRVAILELGKEKWRT
jgi:NADPH-dependent 2,4-dienoyl-CoA reductase/sulfur reductase-like enzyme